MLDDARAQFLAHTAMTRVKAERSQAMLAERHAANVDPEPVVTAEEWLAEHRASDTAELGRVGAENRDTDPDQGVQGPPRTLLRWHAQLVARDRETSAIP